MKSARTHHDLPVVHRRYALCPDNPEPKANDGEHPIRIQRGGPFPAGRRISRPHRYPGAVDSHSQHRRKTFNYRQHPAELCEFTIGEQSAGIP